MAEVADYLGIPITYANMQGGEEKDQFDVCMQAKTFKVGIHPLCTFRFNPGGREDTGSKLLGCSKKPSRGSGGNSIKKELLSQLSHELPFTLA